MTTKRNDDEVLQNDLFATPERIKMFDHVLSAFQADMDDLLKARK